jgi:hypothetical protein
MVSGAERPPFALQQEMLARKHKSPQDRFVINKIERR